KVAQRVGLALPVAGLPVDGQRPLVQLDGPAGLAKLVVAVAEGGKVNTLAVPVAVLPLDGQRLLEDVNGLGESAERPVVLAETALAAGVRPRVVKVALQ